MRRQILAVLTGWSDCARKKVIKILLVHDWRSSSKTTHVIYSWVFISVWQKAIQKCSATRIRVKILTVWTLSDQSTGIRILLNVDKKGTISTGAEYIKEHSNNSYEISFIMISSNQQ